MLSPGGKVRWLCPECRSGEISDRYRTKFGACGSCAECNTYWPWRTRIKVSVKRADIHGKFITKMQKELTRRNAP